MSTKTAEVITPNGKGSEPYREFMANLPSIAENSNGHNGHHPESPFPGDLTSLQDLDREIVTIISRHNPEALGLDQPKISNLAYLAAVITANQRYFTNNLTQESKLFYREVLKSVTESEPDLIPDLSQDNNPSLQSIANLYQLVTAQLPSAQHQQAVTDLDRHTENIHQLISKDTLDHKPQLKQAVRSLLRLAANRRNDILTTARNRLAVLGKTSDFTRALKYRQSQSNFNPKTAEQLLWQCTQAGEAELCLNLLQSFSPDFDSSIDIAKFNALSPKLKSHALKLLKKRALDHTRDFFETHSPTIQPEIIDFIKRAGADSVAEQLTRAQSHLQQQFGQFVDQPTLDHAGTLLAAHQSASTLTQDLISHQFNSTVVTAHEKKYLDQWQDELELSTMLLVENSPDVDLKRIQIALDSVIKLRNNLKNTFEDQVPQSAQLQLQQASHKLAHFARQTVNLQGMDLLAGKLLTKLDDISRPDRFKQVYQAMVEYRNVIDAFESHPTLDHTHAFLKQYHQKFRLLHQETIWLDNFEEPFSLLNHATNLNDVCYAVELLIAREYQAFDTADSRHQLSDVQHALETAVHRLIDVINPKGKTITPPTPSELKTLHDQAIQAVRSLPLPSRRLNHLSYVVSDGLKAIVPGYRLLLQTNYSPDADMVAPLVKAATLLNLAGIAIKLPEGQQLDPQDLTDKIQAIIAATTRDQIERTLHRLPEVPGANLKAKLLYQVIRDSKSNLKLTNFDPDIKQTVYPFFLQIRRHSLKPTFRRFFPILRFFRLA